MNILFISSVPNRSGSAIRYWSICKALSANGHTVTYIEPTLRGTNRVEVAGIHYKPTFFAYWPLQLGVIVSLLHNLLSSFTINADLIIATKPIPNSCLSAIIKKWLGTQRIILDIDDVEYAFYENWVLRGLMRWFNHQLPHFFDRITVPSAPLFRHVAEDIDLSQKRITMLTQGIELDLFREVSKDMNLLKKLGLKGFKVLNYTAHIGPSANLEPTLTVFRNIIHQRNDVKLLVVGGGPHLERYRQMVSAMALDDYVVFTGYVNHTDIPHYMALSDVALNYLEVNESTKHKCLIKIREYLALGLPVVCNLVGDTESFRDFVNICSTLEEYETKILEALESPDIEKAKRGQAYIFKHCDWNKIVKQFIEELI